MAILSYVSENGNVPLTGSLSSSDWYIKHKQNGEDELTFYVDTEFPEYRNLSEETVVEYEDNDYVIKKIQDDKFDAKLNLDFLKATMHFGEYSTGSKTLTQQLRTILGNDWTIQFFGGSITYRRTVTKEDCTDYDLINQFMSTYNCYFQWKKLLKTVIVHKKENEEPSGKYLTNELNLKKVKFHGSTADLVTVLYPKGKDGLTIVGASVSNDLIDKYGLVEGVHYDSNRKYLLNYVECFEYTEKRLADVWSDERYTVKENLLADSLAKVYDSGLPERTYECDVINLAKQNPDYAFLDMRMHLVLTLIDSLRGIDVDHRVVEYVEYPDNHNKDKITLSKVPSNISTSMARLAQETDDSISKSVTALEAAILRATAAITGNMGGYVVLYDSNNDGYPDEILVMDQPDISTAVNVWRWNKAGLAYSSDGYDPTKFEVAITASGEIMADFITAGHLDGALITAGTIEATALSLQYRTSLAQQFLDLADEIENGDQDTYDTVHQELVAQNGSLTSMIQGFNTIESESMTLETENFDVITNWVFSGSDGSGSIDSNDNLKVSITGDSNYYAVMKIEVSDEIKLRFSQPYYYSVTLYATADCTVSPAECRTVSGADRCRLIPSSDIVESVGLNAQNKIELVAGETKTVIIKMNLPSNPIGVGLRFEDASGIDFYITKISLIAKSDIKETFSKITQSVGQISSEVVYNNQLGTKITQNYNSVRIAWNQNSQYIAFEDGKLKVYDSSASTHQLKATFDYNGSHFFHKSNTDEVGKIGTNHWTGNDNYKGLVFDLEANSSYMCWAAKDSSSDSNYNVKLAYYHKSKTDRYKGLYLECNTYANGNLYLNDYYNIAKFSDGVAYAGKFSFGTRTLSSGGYDYTYYYSFNGRNFDVWNGAYVNFYANINMHNFSINNESDIRIKQNIAATQINGLEVLNSIDMKEFEWCGSEEFVPIGIIAQQLEVEAPELVETDDAAGLKSIKTSNLIYYAIKAIQELSAQVEQLQAGTYTGTTYTKAALDMTKEALWAHHYAGDPVGAGEVSEIVSQTVSLPAEASEDDNESEEEEE